MTKRQYRQYNDDEVLGAFQSIKIYISLQSRDIRYKPMNGLLSIIGLIIMLSKFKLAMLVCAS